jgi:uncharacterized membrane protein
MIDHIKSFDYILRVDHSRQFYINIYDQVISHKRISHFILYMCFDKFLAIRLPQWLQLRLEGWPWNFYTIWQGFLSNQQVIVMYLALDVCKLKVKYQIRRAHNNYLVTTLIEIHRFYY